MDKSLRVSPKTVQVYINERLKFLISELGLSVRAFSAQLEVPDTNTRNYLDKGTKLNSEYLEKIARHFKQVNLSWLITGEGQPFTLPANESNQVSANHQKKFQSPSIGINKGTAHQPVGTATGADDLSTKLALAEKEIEGLRNQLETLNQLLASKDTIIAGKDDLLAMLRGGLGRPN